ncbi:sugar phosphate isomerase/epimerase family protein [Paenibacillus sp. HJGM_3]|uniref:sugar phosphate isomerase/epimerase family protein n=1 Tax=Paenibacillus sp. HJGM_3 TaxID=3379816 RepID=UPI00385CB896
MRYNVCSISFRHTLISFRELFRFALESGFGGIEMWGVHAKSLLQTGTTRLDETVREMNAEGVRVSMISHYLELTAPPERYPETERNCMELIDLANRFGTDKIRIFAGVRASARTTASEWQLGIDRLRTFAEFARINGMRLVVETHPHTFADTLPSTLRLLRETNHPSIGINLDFLHLWEAGVSPTDAFEALRPWTVNVHLKNVTDRGSLHVFDPNNVYSPNGWRGGIAVLSDGAVPYEEIVRMLAEAAPDMSASIEWFGSEPHLNVRRELDWLRSVEFSLPPGTAAPSKRNKSLPVGIGRR